MRERDRARWAAAYAAILLVLALAGCSKDDRGEGTPEPGGNGEDTGTPLDPVWDPVPDAGDSTGLPGTDGSTTDTTESDAGFGCIPYTTGCADPYSKQVCNAEGTEFIIEPCPGGSGCVGGECLAQICEPGVPDGTCFSTYEYNACNESGTLHQPVTCPGGLKCNDGECKDLFCIPKSVVCYGTKGFKVCNDDGSAYSEPELCADGALCVPEEGGCADACVANIKAGIYVGCSYFAIDLDNVEGGEGQEVAVVVSVPKSETKPAAINIEDMASGVKLTAADLKAPTLEIAPGELQVFLLPTNGMQGKNPLNGSIKIKASYRITSTAPVSVHQFNPLNGDEVYTNDASLLLPSNLGGKEYFAMSWPHRVFDDGEQQIPFRGFVAIVATELGTTKVDVTARGEIAGGKGVPSIKVNETHTFLLEQGEVLNLETEGEGSDLTGTRIVSDKTITVLSGHECANVPVGVNYCDHIEQQLYPVHAWGSTYVAESFKARNVEQYDMWRVMGGADDVLVTTDPPIKGYESFKLHKGTFVQFQAKQSFLIKATGPVLVGHYMTGSNYPGFAAACTEKTVPSGIGDPALTLAVPTEQFLPSYVVLTPPGYMENYINVVAPDGVAVEIDGVVVGGYEAIGSTGFSAARVPVQTGVHAITGSAPFGVTAYGYDCDVSYAYPGGLKLTTIKGE